MVQAAALIRTFRNASDDEVRREAYTCLMDLHSLCDPPTPRDHIWWLLSLLDVEPEDEDTLVFRPPKSALLTWATHDPVKVFGKGAVLDTNGELLRWEDCP